METFYVSETGWAKLQKRLAEPARELPQLAAFLAEPQPWTEEEETDVQ